MISVESSGLTDVGRKRKGNEDALFYNDELNLYIVADGMGGHQAGEIASDLVVRTMRDYLKRFKNDDEAEELEDADSSLSKEANRLMAGVQLSNKVVFQASLNKRAYRGMGSTVSAVYFTDDTIIAINVGDSPIYLIRRGEVETLSVSHTVYDEQMALNKTGDRHFGAEYSHMLTRAIGVEDTVRPDISELPCYRDDILVLASDGLTNKVNPEEIAGVATGRKPAKACRLLVDMANDRGGDDNITVVILKVKTVEQNSGGIAGLFSALFRMIGFGK